MVSTPISGLSIERTLDQRRFYAYAAQHSDLPKLQRRARRRRELDEHSALRLHLTADGNKPWPFNIGPPIHLPSPATVGIKSGLPGGAYYFVASCCSKPICVTVT
ncbi:MAG: hypothetical protein WA824_05175 [Candidatus Sulfotelmatobacter sp.]